MTFAPGDCSACVEVEDDAAGANGHLGYDAFGAVDLSAGEIGVAEGAVIDAEHGDVGDGADGDLPRVRGGRSRWPGWWWIRG